MDRACLVDPPTVRPEPCLLSCGDYRTTQLAEHAGSGRIVVVIIEPGPMFLAFRHRTVAVVIAPAMFIRSGQISFPPNGLFFGWHADVRHFSTPGRPYGGPLPAAEYSVSHRAWCQCERH